MRWPSSTAVRKPHNQNSLQPSRRDRLRSARRPLCGGWEPLEARYALAAGDFVATLLSGSTAAQAGASASATAIDGSLAVFGSPGTAFDGFVGAGRAHVFDPTTGSVLQTLANPSPADSDAFGSAVAISGDLVVVAAIGDDTRATNAGAVYVYSASTGALLRTILNPTPAANVNFGVSVAISGNLIIVGSPYEDASTTITDSGAAYVFNATTGALLFTLNNPTPANSEHFGAAVAVTGNLAVVGTPRETFGAASQTGVAYVYDVSTGVLLQTLRNPTPASNDLFGTAVAISGSTIVVGAQNDRQ